MAISEVKAKFDSLSTPKKVAVVAGGAAAVAAGAIATTAAIRAGKMNVVNGLNKLSSESSDSFNKTVGELGADSKWGQFKNTLVESLGDKKAGFVDGLKSIFTKEGRKAYKGTSEAFAALKGNFSEIIVNAKEAAAEAAKKAAGTVEKAAE